MVVRILALSNARCRRHVQTHPSEICLFGACVAKVKNGGQSPSQDLSVLLNPLRLCPAGRVAAWGQALQSPAISPVSGWSRGGLLCRSVFCQRCGPDAARAQRTSCRRETRANKDPQHCGNVVQDWKNESREGWCARGRELVCNSAVS